MAPSAFKSAMVCHSGFPLISTACATFFNFEGLGDGFDALNGLTAAAVHKKGGIWFSRNMALRRVEGTIKKVLQSATHVTEGIVRTQNDGVALQQIFRLRITTCLKRDLSPNRSLRPPLSPLPPSRVV